MAVSIGRALARIKADVRAFVPDESIEGAARDAGHRWRERQLGPVETVHLFVLQVIHFNMGIPPARGSNRPGPIEREGLVNVELRRPGGVLGNRHSSNWN